MSKPSWLNNAIIYEVYPQSFYDTNDDGIGDLNGVIEKLDYIKEMGFDAIWLNPFFKSSFYDAGYDINDFFTVDPRYGTNEDFKRLCDIAHQKGLKIICDLVACHTSIDNEWFKMSSKKEKNEFSDYYIWCDDPNCEYEKLKKGDYEREDRYLCSYYETQPAINYGFADIKYSWQMSPDSPVCQRNKQILIDVIEHWISLGCDGYRVDMAHHVIKEDKDFVATHKFWNSIISEMKSKHPECTIFPEWSRPTDSYGSGFDFDMFLSGGSLLRGENKERTTHSYFSKEGLGTLSKFTDDYLNWIDHSKPEYVTFVSGNHDNRRLSRYRDMDDLKVIMAFLLTMPGTPIIYYGDEIGMVQIMNHETEGSLGRGGARSPMQWEKDKKNLGFSNSDFTYLPVDSSENAPTVSEQSNDPNSLLNTVKKLIKIRKENISILYDGNFTLIDKNLNYPFWYERKKNDSTIRVILNPSSNKIDIKETLNGIEVIDSFNSCYDNGIIHLSPCSYLIYSAKS